MNTAPGAGESAKEAPVVEWRKEYQHIVTPEWATPLKRAFSQPLYEYCVVVLLGGFGIVLLCVAGEVIFKLPRRSWRRELRCLPPCGRRHEAQIKKTGNVVPRPFCAFVSH